MPFAIAFVSNVFFLHFSVAFVIFEVLSAFLFLLISLNRSW